MAKFKINWTQVMAGVLSGGLLGSIITGFVNYRVHSGDIDAKMIELSVGILRSEVKQETGPLREWAIDVINKRSGYAFTDTQRTVLMKKELPFKGGGFSDGFSSGFQKFFNQEQDLDPGIVRRAPKPQ